MPKAIWIDAGNDADYAKLRAYGITDPYYAITDPRVTLSYLQNVQGQGFSPGLYAAWNWLPPPYVGTARGAAFATWVSQNLQRIAPNTPNAFPKVQLDIETHDVAYILGALQQWRKHRQARVTSWTLEGYQGGLFSPVDVLHIAAANVQVVPSAYEGNMTPTDAVAVALDLVAHSFPPALVSMFYDAAHLPAAWSGFAFTQGRLP